MRDQLAVLFGAVFLGAIVTLGASYVGAQIPSGGLSGIVEPSGGGVSWPLTAGGDLNMDSNDITNVTQLSTVDGSAGTPAVEIGVGSADGIYNNFGGITVVDSGAAVVGFRNETSTSRVSFVQANGFIFDSGLSGVDNFSMTSTENNSLMDLDMNNNEILNVGALRGGTINLFSGASNKGSINSGGLSMFDGISTTQELRWASATQMFGTTDGLLRLVNNAGSDFTGIQLGGTSASFPMLKKDGAKLVARLADDSAFAQYAGRMENVTGATVAAPVTCDAAALGYMVVVNDTDDVATTTVCYCGQQADDSTYDWLAVDGNGACPHF